MSDKVAATFHGGAETLRRAAALMRERATTAPVGPWIPTSDEGVITAGKWPKGVAQAWSPAYEHIASWDPLVALAVADLLDVSARKFEHLLGVSGCIQRDTTRKPNVNGPCPSCVALRLATAYLGDQS